MNNVVLLQSLWIWVVGGLGGLFGGLALWVRDRFWLRVLGVAATATLALFFALLHYRFRPETFLREGLPDTFRDYFWAWTFLFILAMFWSLMALVRALRAKPARTVEEAAEAPAKDPELDAAWDEILLRLGQAQIDLGRQHVFLLLAPNEDWAAALVQSADMPVFVRAPNVEAPIHAFATNGAVFLSVSGASAFGTQQAGGIAKLEYVCRRLAEQQPDCPPVRGAVVLFPISWANKSDAITRAKALRDDLRAVARALHLRVPVFALFPQMEFLPGFDEFIDRMPPSFRNRRVGFAVPDTETFSAKLADGGLTWLAGWFDGWILDRIHKDPLNSRSNAHLVGVGQEVRRFRNRLRNVLDEAFTTPRDSDPLIFRGCYFLASGATAAQQAFVVGLLRPPHGRVLKAHTSTRWTTEALRQDGRYWRLSMAIGAVGLLLSLGGWAYILSEIPDDSTRWLWRLGPVLLVVTYAVAFLRFRARWASAQLRPAR